MKLKPGCAHAYRDRHRDIWPDLAALLRNAGIRRYGIYLDERTSTLFATMEIDELSAKNRLPLDPIMKKWWVYMADLMETNPDNSPVTEELPEMFYLD
jgi:L-rhamnose mutarotase